MNFDDTSLWIQYRHLYYAVVQHYLFAKILLLNVVREQLGSSKSERRKIRG